ncbi:glycoside hydrolase family 43 protein [Paenibacillus paridis]|uniref:glycoside hydrolase family 43 protein n=1 Tax=Paenibacillus paridis TaxID=2583376 RepID=UPI001121C7E5|nr:glycoside hydrolase family 43 protein [Paenibacillus paridis]
MKYTNPIISGFHPDPSVCRVGDDYYLVTSSFEYFPGIPIFHSQDLVNWEQLGHVLMRESQLQLTRQHSYVQSQGIYAPTIRYYNGRFYVISTNITITTSFYVWADDPKGPWSDPIFINGWMGFDPSLFFDEDGKTYLTGASFPGFGEDGIIQAEINIETGELINESRMIWEGSGGCSPEGPHLYKINGLYYLMIAEGGTEHGHIVTIGRSHNPYGPFENYASNPILSNRSTKKAIQATGHADLTQAADGSWWAVFLGIRPVKSTKLHHLGRETNLAPVKWTEDGWPVIGNDGIAEVTNDAPALPPGNSHGWQEIEHFDDQSLAPIWNFYRNPTEGSWSLSERPGSLSLLGQSCTLNDNSSPTFIGRRQQHFDCTITAHMEFAAVEEGEEAGLTVFMSESFHYDIAKTVSQGKSYILFRRRVGSLWKVEKEVEYAEPSVTLAIKATETSYTFSFISADDNEEQLGNGETAFLSTPIAGGFTGVFFGMYATGNGKPSRVHAHFDYFRYVSGDK